MKTSLKNLPESERPRERMLMLGSGSLSSPELIALILGSGVRGKSVLTLATELLAHFGSLTQLAHTTIEELCQIKGLGKAKAIQLKAAFSLWMRLQKERLPAKEPLHTPEACYEWVKEYLAYEKKEIFGVILLDVRGKAYKWEVVSIGTLTQTLVHPREVFYSAIRHLAASLILVHNHPSGDPTPSPHDWHLTRHLLGVGQTMGIPIFDHLIVADKDFVSLRAQNRGEFIQENNLKVAC
jgi:DNA repair protein RadC